MNYPELAICPYNATHRVKKCDLEVHLLNCKSVYDVKPNDIPVAPGVNKPNWTLQQDYLKPDPADEEWDD